MKDEIKKGLLDTTPELQISKERVKRVVLQQPKKQVMPMFVFGCFIVLLIILISTEIPTNKSVQGYSEQAFQMYELLDDADLSEEYHIDLMLAKYGGLRGIEKNKQDIKERVELYEATLPKTFDKVLKENGITRQEYKKQFLELKAYVQVVRDTLMPQYGNAYPEFPEEVHAQLLLFDAAKEVEGNMPFNATVDIHAIVLYEGENARVLALIEEKQLLEEQLIIMPIRDSLKLKAGEEVLLENSFMTSISSEKVFKQFVVSQNVKLITINKTAIIPVMQKQVNACFEQMTWHDIDFSTSREPDAELKTIGGNFYIWYGDDIIIGSEEKAFVISEEKLKGWGKNFIQN